MASLPVRAALLASTLHLVLLLAQLAQLANTQPAALDPALTVRSVNTRVLTQAAAPLALRVRSLGQ